MNIQEMRSWFDIIQDKFNSPYFTDLEFEEFVNQGQQNLVNEVLYGQFLPSTARDERGGQNMNPSESNIQSSELIQPLVVPDVAVNSDATGLITNTALNSSLSSAVGLANQEYMHVLSVILSDSGVDRLCRFVRHNDYVKFKANMFKGPTLRSPIYRIFRGGIKIDPDTIRAYKVSLIKRPIDVSLELNVDCELPDQYHGMVVAYAIKLASIASRDEALSVMTSSNMGGGNPQ